MSQPPPGTRTSPPRHAWHRYLMQHPTVLRWVTRSRLVYYTRILRRPLRRHKFPNECGHPLQWTLEYNASHVGSLQNRRSFRMIKMVSCVSGVKRDGPVLFIGPRNEADILTLYAFGFAWDSIRGLDLFSYSPKIEVGDMHELPYADGSFDIALSSWALTYSHDPRRACQELLRVTRPGGIIGVGCEYDRQAVARKKSGHGREVLLNCWFADLDELKACFGDGVGDVLWTEQAPNIWVPGDKDDLTLVFRKRE